MVIVSEHQSASLTFTSAQSIVSSMAGRPPLSTVRRCCTELGLQSVACLGNEEHLSVGLPICNAFPVPRSEVPVRTAIAPRFELHGMQLSDVSDQCSVGRPAQGPH